MDTPRSSTEALPAEAPRKEQPDKSTMPQDSPEPTDPSPPSRWAPLLLKYSDTGPTKHWQASTPANDVESPSDLPEKSHLLHSKESDPFSSTDDPLPHRSQNESKSMESEEEDNEHDNDPRRRIPIWQLKLRTLLMSDAEFDAVMEKHHITLELLKAKFHLANEQTNEAHSVILQALEVAKRLNQEPIMARCIYWLGRIEYIRENHSEAYRHFLDARPCIGQYPEGEELPVYLSLFGPGVTEKERFHILTKHSQSTLAAHKEKGPFGNSTKHAQAQRKAFTKRKWKPNHEQIIRMPPSSAATGQRKSTRNWRSIIQKNASHPTVWLTQESEDQHIHPDDQAKEWPLKSPTSSSSIPDTPQSQPNREMDWLAASEKFPRRPKQESFTFRMYPQELATRTRSTEIFDEQPWEIIMSATEWEATQEKRGEKAVTMGHLARERRRLERRAIDKSKGCSV